MDEWKITIHLGKTKAMVVSRVKEECSLKTDSE